MADTPLGYYKWYPRDFATSIVVRSMSFTARAIYRELLDVQWENGCLPNAKRLLSIIGASEEQWQEFSPYLDELFPNGVNKKLDEMRNEALERQEKRKVAGSKGGVAKQKSSKRKANAKQLSSQTETETYIEKVEKEFETVFESWSNQRLFPSLREQWRDYMLHRREKKQDPYTGTGLAKMRAAFENAAPEGRAAELLCIVTGRAMFSNWKGLPPEVVKEEGAKLATTAQPHEGQKKMQVNEDGTVSFV